MEINFNNLDFKRVIMHTIVPKQANAEAYVIPQKQVYELSDDVKDTLRTRLIDAAGRGGKIFQLSIKDTYKGSFYQLCSKMKNCSEQEFIDNSEAIANRLANSQKHNKLQGGFLLIVHGIAEDTNKDWYITIKAEPHQALTSRMEGDKATLEVLDKIFLSPTQKLFKIGMIEEVNLEYREVNQKYNCYLFDHQFSAMDMPARYFYEDFLGFSIEFNMKIQSKKYYSITEAFIRTNELLDAEEKEDALDALRLQFKNNLPRIEPEAFGIANFKNEEVQSQFAEKIATNKIPGSFLKDKSLIKMRLSTKNMDFPSNIKVSGPDDEFAKRVKIIKTQDALENLRVNDGEFTVLVIIGKPFKK